MNIKKKKKKKKICQNANAVSSTLFFSVFLPMQQEQDPIRVGGERGTKEMQCHVTSYLWRLNQPCSQPPDKPKLVRYVRKLDLIVQPIWPVDEP